MCVIAQRYADYALKQLANNIIKLPTGRSNYFKCPPRGQANELEKEVRRRTCPRAFQGD